ncbi:MAG: ATP-binding cassette domain-containing protein [Crocinitomicaceae bacterium]|nr:ATP-binding cassette domain-containing protein [Crocinitomicaceae bacterium]
MSETVIKVDNISKMYDLGLVGTGTLSKDLNRTIAKLRGKPDPYATIAELNDRTQRTNTKSGSVWALKDINFEVKKGEVLGIIGKNGAGKSTLLKILSQITTPTTGDIKIKGRVASLLEVGTGMHPEMTARQNIYLNGAIMGMTRKEVTAKLDEIVEFAGIGKYLDTPTKRFSSGMTVRLGFAVAAFLEPEILIVDEVLAVGDAEFQKKAIGKMQDVSKGEGRTVLFVSHNMASIQKLCNKAFVIDKGTVVFKGDVEESIQFYLRQNKENSELNLKSRKDRQNAKNFKFTKIEILNEMNENIANINSGMKVKFKIYYDLKYETKIKGIRVLFKDSQQVIRILSNTGQIGLTPKVFKQCNDGYVIFEYEKFPLPKGEFNVHLSCYSDDGVEDDIEHAFEFNVEGGDFYGTGREAYIKDGVLVNFTGEC